MLSIKESSATAAQCRASATNVCNISQRSSLQQLGQPSKLVNLRAPSRSIPPHIRDGHAICCLRTIAVRSQIRFVVRGAKDAYPAPRLSPNVRRAPIAACGSPFFLCSDGALVMFHTVHQLPRRLTFFRNAPFWERLCDSGMSEHRLQQEQEPKWPDWTWIALILAVLLAGFVLWQGDQSNVQAFLVRLEP
jgi:hypothetical protein